MIIHACILHWCTSHICKLNRESVLLFNEILWLIFSEFQIWFPLMEFGYQQSSTHTYICGLIVNNQIHVHIRIHTHTCAHVCEYIYRLMHITFQNFCLMLFSLFVKLYRTNIIVPSLANEMSASESTFYKEILNRDASRILSLPLLSNYPTYFWDLYKWRLTFIDA